MSESDNTQCPLCSTSFRVNVAQLGAANGAVRCGTCLIVFNALLHQVGGAARANAPSAAE
ncbi:MJ0042-type zinc finger domain-containing protein, partial [Pseudomonas aeruginosa]|uniref:MJ0042-type zinc finger domain-containing protein n=1 Tax=Pseudomonas aeruginosa TaxID=287 RepID=UPI003CC642AC